MNELTQALIGSFCFASFVRRGRLRREVSVGNTALVRDLKNLQRRRWWFGRFPRLGARHLDRAAK